MEIIPYYLLSDKQFEEWHLQCFCFKLSINAIRFSNDEVCFYSLQI